MQLDVALLTHNFTHSTLFTISGREKKQQKNPHAYQNPTLFDRVMKMYTGGYFFNGHRVEDGLQVHSVDVDAFVTSTAGCDLDL